MSSNMFRVNEGLRDRIKKIKKIKSVETKQNVYIWMKEEGNYGLLMIYTKSVCVDQCTPIWIHSGCDKKKYWNKICSDHF